MMYTKLIALFSLLAASAIATDGDATFFDATPEQGACADEHIV